MDFYESEQQPVPEKKGRGDPLTGRRSDALLSYLGVGSSALIANLENDQLVAALKHQDWSVRVAAARKLGRSGDAAAVAALVAGLEDSHKAVRAAAARALGACKAKVPIAPLVEALRDSDWHVRSAAVMALGKQKNSAPVSPLEEMIRDEDESVRAAAVWAIGELGERAPIKPLVEALHDAAASVREAAVNALAALGTRAPLGPLLSVRDDEDASVQRAVEEALQRTHPELFAGSDFDTGALTAWRETDEARAILVVTEKTASYQGKLKRSPVAQSWGRRRAATSEEKGTRSKIQVLRQFTNTAAVSPKPIWSRLVQIGERVLVAAVLLGLCVSWLMLGYRFHSSSTGSPYVSTLFHYQASVGGITRVLWEPVDGAASQNSLPFIAFADTRGRVQVWNMAKQQYATAYGEFNKDTVLSFVWTSNGMKMAFRKDNGTIILVRTSDSSRSFMQIPGPDDTAPVASWSPDGKYIAISFNAQGENSIHVWDTMTNSEVAVHNVQGTGRAVASIAWSADGKIIASTSTNGSDGRIEIWGADTGKSLLPADPTPYWDEPFNVVALTWAPDGQRLAYMLSDGEVRVRDQRTDTDTLLNLQSSGSKGLVGALAWSPDGQRLASSRPGGTILVWDVASGSLLYTYNGHAQPVSDIAWEPNGKQIASASVDGLLLVWGAS